MRRLILKLTVKLIVKLIVKLRESAFRRLKSRPKQHGWTPRRSATPPTLWAAHFVPLDASLRLPARHVSSPTVPSQDPPQKSGYVHALLTTCLSIRFTPAQIGWTPPGFYGGSWLFEPDARAAPPSNHHTVGGVNTAGAVFDYSAPPKSGALPIGMGECSLCETGYKIQSWRSQIAENPK
jgi:hypothetical protein